MAQSQDVLRALQAIPLFSTLSDEETWDILRCCEHHTVPAGTVLFEQGSEGNSAFLVSAGRVEIRLRSETDAQVVARFGPGDVFGELSLLDSGPRSADAVAVEETTCYELRGDRFDVLRRDLHPGACRIVRHLTRVVARRLRDVNLRIEEALTGGIPREVRTARLTPAPGRLDADPAEVASGAPRTTEGAGFFRRIFGRLFGNDEEA